MDLETAKSFIQKYSFSSTVFLLGLCFLGIGIVGLKTDVFEFGTPKVEVLEKSVEVNASGNEVIVEIAGAVNKPGIYNLSTSARVDDLIKAGGGFTQDADLSYIEHTINRAGKLTDGQKIYIPKQSIRLSASNNLGIQTTSTLSQNQGSGLTNINSASLAQLDKLPGIGPVYGQKIIEHRPYSSIEELTKKDVVTLSVYDKIKHLISTY